MKHLISYLLPLVLACAMCACNNNQQQVQTSTEQRLLGAEEFKAEMLKSTASKEAAMDKSLEKLSPEQLDGNIDLAYLIYSNRSIEQNQQNPLTVCGYTNEERDRLWEAYLMQSELTNFAASINNEGASEYIVAILKPNEFDKLKVYESIKLLRSGYVGGLSDSHSMTVDSTFTKQVGDYYILCMCPDAANLGNAISTQLETQLKRTTEGQ